MKSFLSYKIPYCLHVLRLIDFALLLASRPRVELADRSTGPKLDLGANPRVARKGGIFVVAETLALVANFPIGKFIYPVVLKMVNVAS